MHRQDEEPATVLPAGFGLLFKRVRTTRTNILRGTLEIYIYICAYMHMHFPRWRRIWNFSRTDRPLCALIVPQKLRLVFGRHSRSQTETIVNGTMKASCFGRTRVKTYNWRRDKNEPVNIISLMYLWKILTLINNIKNNRISECKYIHDKKKAKIMRRNFIS